MFSRKHFYTITKLALGESNNYEIMNICIFYAKITIFSNFPRDTAWTTLKIISSRFEYYL